MMLKSLLKTGIFLFVLSLIELSVVCSRVPAQEEVQFVKDLKIPVNPLDVAVADTGELYVLTNQGVSIYDSEGQFLKNFDEPDPDPARLKGPSSLAFSPRGRVAVADTKTSQIRVFDKTGNFLFQFGSLGTHRGEFHLPMSVVMDQFGFIFVADQKNRRIQIFSPNGVYLNEFPTESDPADLGMDRERNLYVLFPAQGKIITYSAEGKKLRESSFPGPHGFLQWVKAIAVDNRGDIFMADGKERSIKKFDKKRRLLISFGSQGQGRGQFGEIFGMTIDPQGQIYVADYQNKCVQVFKVLGSSKLDLPEFKNSPLVLDFDSTIEAAAGISDIFSVPGKGLYLLTDQTSQVMIKGRQEDVMGRAGHEAGEFTSPQGLHVTLNGQMFVADTGNDRVQIFNENKEPAYHFGSSGSSPGQFHRPEGVVVNSKGEIFVSDTLNRRIQVFNYDGIYLKSFGKSRRFSQASTDAELHYPKAMAVDSKDRVYVVDKELDHIQVYSPEGDYWGSIGETGSGNGQFLQPVDLAIDDNNTIYVADRGNHRIQIFDNQGKFLLSFGARGRGQGYFQEISALAVSEGRIYVADYASQEIQVFRYTPEAAESEKRIFATHTAVPSVQDKNIVYGYHLAKLTAIEEGVTELMATTGLSREKVMESSRIESVSSLNSGGVKVTVSFPMKPGEIKFPEAISKSLGTH